MQVTDAQGCDGITEDRSAVPFRHLMQRLLRGGRLAKLGGLVVSYAPQFGMAVCGGAVSTSVTRAALPVLGAVTAAGLLSGTSARAQTICAQTPPAGSGVFVCSGTTSAPQTLDRPLGIDATMDAAASITVDGSNGTGDALELRADSIIGEVVFEQAAVDAATGGGAISSTSGYGIDAYAYGELSITVTGDVSGTTGGIGAYAINGPVTVDASHADASVSGDTYGIYAYAFFGDAGVSSGGGGVSAVDGNAITASSLFGGRVYVMTGMGRVTSTNGGGILASSRSDVSVTTYGDVFAASVGIEGVSDGGAITIKAGGRVRSQLGEAISATNDGGAITVLGSSGIIIGATDGQYLRSAGGDIRVQDLDLVRGETGDAIDALSAGGAITIRGIGLIEGNYEVADVDADGIRAVSGGGTISIQDIADITTASNAGYTSRGIYANASGGDGDILIGTETAIGAVRASTTGIYAITDGGGEISVTGSGAISSGDYGLQLTSTGAGGITTNLTGAVSSRLIGIDVDNSSGGDVSLTANGEVRSTQSSGISVYNNAPGAITITAADVSGGNGFGINAISTYDPDSTDISITAIGTVSSAGTGIRAYNDGTGGISISTVNAFGGTQGIIARAGDDTTGGVSITSTGSIYGYGPGLLAQNQGTGEVNIAINESYSRTAEAIRVFQTNAASGDVTVTATGLVDGNNTNIISNSGTGGITASFTDVTSRSGDGLQIANEDDDSTGLEVTVTGTVNAYVDGIDVRNFSSGYRIVEGPTIVRAADVYAERGYGIFVTQAPNGGRDVIIDQVGTVESELAGVYARNLGGGGVSITTGDVTSRTSQGIYAYSLGALSIDIDTSAGTVTGALDGIVARQALFEAVTITVDDVRGTTGIRVSGNEVDINLTSTADVVGTSYQGIYAQSGRITVQGSSGNISGATDGVYLRTFGGPIVVQSLHSVTGNAGDALNLDSAGGDITIDAVDAITGIGGDGISAISGAGAIDIGGSTAVGDVSGSMNGIAALADSGPVRITVSGDVSGGTGAGISNSSVAGATLSVTLESGASLSATSGEALIDTSGDSTITVESGASITGAVRLGEGSDSFTSAAGLSGITVLDGGDDGGVADGMIDRLTLTGRADLNDAELLNWESITLSDGEFTSEELTLGFEDSLVTSGLFLSNATLTDPVGLSVTGNMDIDQNSTFFGGGGGDGLLFVTGSLSNLGTINMADGTPGDTIGVVGSFEGGGRLVFDVDFATAEADQMFLNNGQVVGATTTIAVNDVSSGTPTGEDVLLVRSDEETASTAFALEGTSIDSGIFRYSLAQSGSDWILKGEGVNPLGAVVQATPLAVQQSIRLDSWRTRTGARRGLSFGAVAPGDQGAWLRVFGERSDWELTSSSTLDGLETRTTGIQLGYDHALMELGGGILIGGLNVASRQTDLTASNSNGSASIETDILSVGATLTWLGDTGVHVDAQLEAAFFDTAIAGASVEGDALTASVELGRRFDLGDGLSLTPEIQATRSSVDLDAVPLAAGQVATVIDGETTRVRLGVTAEKDWTRSDGGRGNLYGVLNLHHVSDGNTALNVSGTALTGDTSGWSAEFGVGGSVTLGNGAQVFGEITRTESLSSNVDFDTTRASVGMQWAF